MSERDALLAAILAEPDRDEPRLACAAWLGRQGSPHGEFIRVQCALARLPDTAPDYALLKQREEQLLATERDALLGPLAGLPLDVRCERGFVVSVTLAAKTFLRHADLLFRQAPLREVCLKELHGQIHAVAASAHLQRLERLFLTFNDLHADEMRALAGSPYLGNLTTLNLGHNRLGDDGVRALAQSKHLPALRHLWLAKNEIGDDGARWLAQSPLTARLQTLRLNGNRLGDAAVQALAVAPWPQLQGLNLSGNPFGDVGALALARSPYLDRLDWLLVKKVALGTEVENILQERFGPRLNADPLS